MANNQNSQEKFKTMIGGQALIEGIMMRGPKLDAVVVRGKEGICIETAERKIRPKGSVLNWPFIRGAVNFFDAQVTGVKSLMRSADLSPEGEEELPKSKLEQWLENKLGEKKFQDFLVGAAVALGIGLSVLIFIMLPHLVVGFLNIGNDLLRNLLEGVLRISLFFAYMILISKMNEMQRVFAYHGAEHKTIRCYEAGLELTVENVRMQSRKHPRCGTSFLFVVLLLSILVFSAASSLLLELIPALAAMKGSFLFTLIMMLFKLLLLPVVVSIAYEVNRLVGRYDNWLTRILTVPGQWFQNYTTFEPDDEMIEVGIAALTAVLPTEEGEDRW